MHQLNMYSFSKALQSRWTAGSSRWVVQKALPQLLQRRWLGSQGGEQSPTHPANSHCLRRFNFKCWRTEIFPCSATRRASYSLQACSIQKPLLSEHDLLLALMSLFLYLPLAVLPKVCVGAEGRCRSCPQRLVACTGAACSPLPSHQIGLIVSKTRMATSSTQVFRAIGLKIYVFLWQWIIEGLVASRHCLKSLFWSVWRFMDRLSKSWNMLSSGGLADLAANTRLRVLRPFLATEMYSWGSSKWSGGFYFFFFMLAEVPHTERDVWNWTEHSHFCSFIIFSTSIRRKRLFSFFLSSPLWLNPSQQRNALSNSNPRYMLLNDNFHAFLVNTDFSFWRAFIWIEF